MRNSLPILPLILWDGEMVKHHTALEINMYNYKQFYSGSISFESFFDKEDIPLYTNDLEVIGQTL